MIGMLIVFINMLVASQPNPATAALVVSFVLFLAGAYAFYIYAFICWINRS